MFWVSDVKGRVASISQQWHGDAPTGGNPPDLSGDEVAFNDVHRDDVEALRTLLSAHRAQEVAGCFRVRRNDSDDYVWVSFVGRPAVSPDDGSFCGYIGSATVAQEQDRPSSSRVQSSRDQVARRAYLDDIRGRLLSARALAAAASDRRIEKVIDLALVMVDDRRAADEV